MTDTIKVLIVDDIPETRDHLTKLLGFEGDIVVIGSAASGVEAIDLAKSLVPDVVPLVVPPGVSPLSGVVPGGSPSFGFVLLPQADAMRIAVAAKKPRTNRARRAIGNLLPRRGMNCTSRLVEMGKSPVEARIELWRRRNTILLQRRSGRRVTMF